MEYQTWAPLYERIRAEFDFPYDREERAAARLEALLPAVGRRDALGRLGHRLAGRIAVVVGLAPRAGPPPLWRLGASPRSPTIVCADGATETCLSSGLVPNVIVTDLDGPVPSEIAANGRGSLAVIHAHGDNVPALEEWVPHFPGALAGSWAGPPRGPLLDVGGFTDGDRAAYLAVHCGASRVLLWGFDFERVDAPSGSERERKLAKLAWARRALEFLAERTAVPIVLWRPDGSMEAYPAGRNEASTR